MGSDSRDGEGNNIDGLTGGGERLGTTIMIHLSADRQNAYGVSIPRDSLVDRPECYDEDGDTIPGATSAMWNEAFSVGGPACTIRQFEQLTDIRINNYVVVDFQGFQSMVDAIDGSRSASRRTSTTASTASSSRPAPARSPARRRSPTSGSGTSRAPTAATWAGSSGSRRSSPRWPTRCSRAR